MRKSATSKGMGNMRGSVSGSLWALVLGSAGLGVASQISGPPARQAVAEVEASSPAAPVEALVAEDEASTDATAAAEETSADVTEQAAQAADVEDEAPEVAQAPAQEPELPDLADEAPTDVVIAPDRPVVPGATGAATPVVNATGEPAPALPETTPKPDVVAETPVVTAPATDTSEAPSAPAQDTDVAVAEAPAPLETPVDDADRLPAPTTTGSGLTPAAQALLDAVDEEPAQVPSTDDPVQSGADDTPILEDTAPVVPELADEPAPEVEIATEEPTAPAIEFVTEDPVAPAIEVVTEEPIAPAETPAPVIEEPVVAEVPEPAPLEEDAPSDAVAESSSLPATTTGVRVNRPGAEPADQPGQEAELVEGEQATEALPAITRFAAEFENPRKLPMLSFALVDDGSIADLAGEVAKLDMPVTVILDPLGADAPARMAALRAAGVEVGFQASLPDGATPADVEIAMEAAFGSLPEAVTLFSDGQDGVQQSRAVTGQVLAVLAAEGRGLVIAQRGLGNAVRNATQAGVPTAQVARDIDTAGQSEAAIGRSLDQAAFRARQTGASVLTGTLNSFNLAALSAWASGVDQDQLLLAPVTGVLRDPPAN